MTYRPAIDGLRTIAVLSVLLFHLNHQWLPGGFVGVDVFFVISGFLITSILYGECRQNDPSLARFYQRRVARIFPAFTAVALTTLAVAFFVYLPQDLASCGANFSAAFLSAINIKLMFQGNYFVLSPDSQPFLHYWTLAVEEQFYMVFPLLLLALYRFARHALVSLLLVVGIASFAWGWRWSDTHPTWAFYLLPTRGWELLAGGVLAIISIEGIGARHARWWRIAPPIGLLLILTSFLLVHEGTSFPGWIALLPVIGTVLVITPFPIMDGWVERCLAQPAMVALGKRSYSLYLWHWPVYSFVDYAGCWSSAWLRFSLKIGLSIGAAFLCYRWIERPSRDCLNRRQNRWIVFSALVAVLIVCVSVGVVVRNTYYVNARTAHGIVFGAKRTAGSMVLIGDSNGSMYGTALRDWAEDRGYKLIVMSWAAGDPLPTMEPKDHSLWDDSYASVTNERPAVVILACHWSVPSTMMSNRMQRIRLAVDALRPYAGQVILVTQPPQLPANASRMAIREGARPPFYEDHEVGDLRMPMNQYVASLQSGNVVVLDAERSLRLSDGSIRFLDDRGRMMYQDAGHLSHYGALAVMKSLGPLVEK